MKKQSEKTEAIKLLENRFIGLKILKPLTYFKFLARLLVTPKKYKNNKLFCMKPFHDKTTSK